MGKNIFEIELALQRTLDTIEEAGGELTEETLRELEINEQNLADKIDAYCQVITKYKSEDTCCKEEKSRINDIQKGKKNVVERLKNVLLDAILKFGEDGKSGNKVYNTATHKLFTKNSTSFDTNYNRLNELAYGFLEYMQSIYDQGILVTGKEMNLPAVLDCLNANLKAKANAVSEFEEGIPPVEGTQPTSFVPFTIEDLKATKLEITFESSLFDLFDDKEKLGLALVEAKGFSEFKPDINESFINILNELGNNAIDKCTLGHNITKQSLTIK